MAVIYAMLRHMPSSCATFETFRDLSFDHYQLYSTISCQESCSFLVIPQYVLQSI